MPCAIVESDANTYSAGLIVGRQLDLSQTPCPGAFVVADYLGLGVLDGVRLRARYAVPADLRIVGFDNIAMAGWAAYRMASIDQPVDLLAHQAVALLLRRMEQPNATPQRRVVPGTLAREFGADP